MELDKIAQAIEADAGENLPRLRESLQSAQQGMAARTHTPEQIMVREVRRLVHLSQVDFAARIATPLPTLRDWEQGRSNPPGAVSKLMGLIRKHPSLIDDLINNQTA